MRLLTRRFIGDYDPNLERCYSVNTVVDNDPFLLEILDSGGHYLEVFGQFYLSSCSVFIYSSTVMFTMGVILSMAFILFSIELTFDILQTFELQAEVVFMLERLENATSSMVAHCRK